MNTSDTPRTDYNSGFVLDGNAFYPQSFDLDSGGTYVLSDFARQLERELNAANAEIARLNAFRESEKKALEYLQSQYSALEKAIDPNMDCMGEYPRLVARANALVYCR